MGTDCGDSVTVAKHWEIVHIPDKPLIPPHLQPTVNVHAALIEPKLANAVVRKLNQIAPLENLRHVKRVRKICHEGGNTQLSVILCMDYGNDGQPNGIPDDVVELVNLYHLSTFITKVCKYAASTKEEWEEQCKLWPTSYHPPTYNISGITGFIEEDKQSVFSFMKFAIDLAKSGHGPVVNAAVIVDPSTKQIIASASDQVLSRINSMSNTEASSTEHLKNTIMSSGTDKGNHEMLVSNGSDTEAKGLFIGASCLDPWRWADQEELTSSGSWHPLHHAAIAAIQCSATRDRYLFPANTYSVEEFPQEDYMSPPSSSPSKRQKTVLTDIKDATSLDCQAKYPDSATIRPYLCTGYDIYLVWEPCAMCAMALVHQRVRRIFYAFSNTGAGALGSVHRLQGEKSLNHHYAVFRVLLPEEVLEREISGVRTAVKVHGTNQVH